MAKMISPSVQILINNQNERMFKEIKNGSRFGLISYPTYRELKRDLKRLMEEWKVTRVTVYRSRRGEWGEWFEHWELNNGKLFLEKEGWM